MVYGVPASFSDQMYLESSVPYVFDQMYFDVPMGCFDEAEVFELVGTFILNNLKNVFQNNTYRDDELAVIKASSGPEIERLKKKCR